MNNTQAPKFSPSGGIGSVWKDKTGKTWKFTETGWVDTSENKSVSTFDLKPEDEGIVTALKFGGAKETDIQNALKQRQQILASKQTEPTTTDMEASIDQGINALKIDSSDPFKGKTKLDVLREAFNNGVTDSAQLDKISKTYDLLAPQPTMGVEGQDLTKLTPAQKQAVRSQIEKDAVAKMQALPDATSRDSALSSLTTFKNGDEIIKLLKSGNVNTGLIRGGMRKGIFGIGGRSAGWTSKEEDYFAALTETFAANFRKALSGTAVSGPEMARLDAFLPNETKTEQANIEGIKAISDYLANKTNLQLGMDVSALKPEDEGDDPLEILGGGASKNNPLGI